MRYFLEGTDLFQYNTVIDCYKRYIANSTDFDSFPEQFKTEDIDVGSFGTTWLFSSKKKRVLYQYNQNSFYISFWKLPPATMIPIRNALNAICAYQLNRYNRKFGSGHLYDMTNLVCEHLKSWLLKLAGRNLIDAEHVKNDISRHIEYVKSLEKNNIFPSSRTGIKHDITMNSTLLEVASCLGKTIEEIDAITQKRSLREVISNVTRYTESVVDSTLQYLFYVLRSNKAPAAINMQRLSWIELHSFDKIRSTRSFKLLNTLLNSPYVKQVNRQQATSFNERHVFVNHLEDLHVKKEGADGLGVSSDVARTHSYLNQCIGGNLVPDRNFLRRWWSNVHSGIESSFQKQSSVLQAFVKLHGLVERISFFSIICRQMEDIVDYFGMMVWASFGAKVLDYFQEAFKRLNNEYRSCSQIIHESARSHYNTLIQNNKGQSNWCANFNHADRLFDTAMHDMEHALANMSAIPKTVERFQTIGCDRQAQQRLTSFADQLTRFGLLFQMQPLTYDAVEGNSTPASMIANL